MRPFRTAVKWPTWFIWSSLHLSSCLLSFCSISPLAISLSPAPPFPLQSCWHSTPAVLPQWQETDVRCQFHKLKTWDNKCIHTRATCTTQWQLHHAECECLSVIRKALQVNFSSQKHVYTHTATSPVPASEGSDCVSAAGVTGPSSPQTTDRYNQLSWDASRCCHSHYSSTNTCTSNSQGCHWPLHYVDLHTHIHTHNSYIFNTNHCTHCQHSLLSNQHILYISYQRNCPFRPPWCTDQNNHIISKLRSNMHI